MIETLKEGLAEIPLTPSKTAKELDGKVISLVNAINEAIEVLIHKARLCPRSVPGFNDGCKNVQIRTKEIKKGMGKGRNR